MNKNIEIEHNPLNVFKYANKDFFAMANTVLIENLDIIVKNHAFLDQSSYKIKNTVALSVFTMLDIGKITLLEHNLSLCYQNITQLLKQKEYPTIKSLVDFCIAQNGDNAETYKNFYKIWDKIYKNKLKNITSNETDALKLIRDCIAHNNEINEEDFQKRVVYDDFDEFPDFVKDFLSSINGIMVPTKKAPTNFTYKIKSKDKGVNVSLSLGEIENIVKLMTIICDVCAKPIFVHDNPSSSSVFVYNDKSLEFFDEYQNKIEKLHEKFVYPKDSSSIIASANINFIGFLENFDFNKDYNITYLKILRDYLTFASLNHYLTNAKEQTLAKNLKYKFYLDESEKDIIYAVKKIRNSIIHGRYFYDPTQQKYVLYDQAKNKTSYNELSIQQKALVDKCINNNLGSKKIKNLKSFAVLSSKDLFDVFASCCGFVKPKHLKHNTLANTITNIIETQKQTQNTLVLKQKNSN